MADEQTVARQESPRVPPKARPGGARHLRALEEALVGLRRAVKDLAFYPAGHPTLQQSLERVGIQLRQVVEADDPLTLTISRDGIAHPLGAVGKANPTIKSLASELYLCRVKRVHIGGNFTPEELKAFLVLAGKDPKKVHLEGGPEAILKAAEAINIQVNQLEFKPIGGKEDPLQAPVETSNPGGAGEGLGGRDFLAAIAAAQGAEEKEGTVQSPDLPPDAIGDIGGGAAQGLDDPALAATPTLSIEEEGLTPEETLARLEAATAALEYKRLARRLEPAAAKAMMDGELEAFLYIASVLARHRDDPGRSPEVREAAAQWLVGVIEAGALDFLVDRVCQKDVAHSGEIIGFLEKLGEPAVQALLGRLAVEETMSARRRLMAAIGRLGDMALPHLLRGLEDERWFVVRNMAAILGDIRREGTLEALGGTLRHSERRVRREVVRAIAKIGGRNASRLLRECLTDTDLGVRQAAVGFLGTARDPLALQPLMAMAGAKVRDSEELELRKAAILALGQLGNRVALPLLLRLVHKRAWFRRAETEEVRLAAVAALGQFGGPEAVETLQRAGRRGGRLGEACQQVLARLGG